MAEESLVEGEDENILYDLLVISEWPPEADLQVTVPWCFDIYFFNCCTHTPVVDSVL